MVLWDAVPCKKSSGNCFPKPTQTQHHTYGGDSLKHTFRQSTDPNGRQNTDPAGRHTNGSETSDSLATPKHFKI